MARVAVTTVTTVAGFLVIPLGRVGQGSETREHPRCLLLGTLRATSGEGTARFSVTAVTWRETRREQGEGSTRRCCVRKTGKSRLCNSCNGGYVCGMGDTRAWRIILHSLQVGEWARGPRVHRHRCTREDCRPGRRARTSPKRRGGRPLAGRARMPGAECSFLARARGGRGGPHPGSPASRRLP